MNRIMIDLVKIGVTEKQALKLQEMFEHDPEAVTNAFQELSKMYKGEKPQHEQRTENQANRKPFKEL